MPADTAAHATEDAPAPLTPGRLDYLDRVALNAAKAGLARTGVYPATLRALCALAREALAGRAGEAPTPGPGRANT